MNKTRKFDRCVMKAINQVAKEVVFQKNLGNPSNNEEEMYIIAIINEEIFLQS
jgi:hypothetical protein